MLGDLANWVQDVINQFGYFGVALLVVIENIFPPIPSEIVLLWLKMVLLMTSER